MDERETDLRPVVTLRWDSAEDGTYTASMIVSGIRTAAMAEGAMLHMQTLFCGKEMELQHAN